MSGAKDERDMFLCSTLVGGAESREVGSDEPHEPMEWEVSEDIWIEINPKKILPKKIRKARSQKW